LTENTQAQNEILASSDGIEIEIVTPPVTWHFMNENEAVREPYASPAAASKPAEFIALIVSVLSNGQKSHAVI
jgi:hypothetical protein